MGGCTSFFLKGCIINKKEVKKMGYRNFDRPPRTMTKAVCSDCGQECEVPFVPTEGRPVYCRTCWEKHRPPRRDRYRY